MATENEKRGTGFACPTIGKMVPEGSTFKKNPDGTVTIVPPKEDANKE